MAKRIKGTGGKLGRRGSGGHGSKTAAANKRRIMGRGGSKRINGGGG